jgi:hypothetical protein
MSDLLPWLFIVTAVVAMLGGLVSLWLSLSLALSDQVPVGTRAQLTSDARIALLTEKEALLQEIRDVAFEHDAGKLSDTDYEELNAKLRAQARHVLHELDATAEGFREEAEALIAQRLGKEG